MDEIFEAGEGDDEVVEAHDGVDLVVDAADVGGDLGVEEGAGDDFEGELHAGGGDVDLLVGAPGFLLGVCAGYDLVSVGGDALAVEGGGDDAALALVDGIVGGDEAFAEEDLHAADGALFDEAGGLVDENFTDVFGVVDEDDWGAQEAIVGDVAVGLKEVLEEADGVAEFDPGFEGVEGKGVFQARGHAPFCGFRSGSGWGFEGWGRGVHVAARLLFGKGVTMIKRIKTDKRRSVGRSRWLGSGCCQTRVDYFFDAGLNVVDGGVVADGDDSLGFAGGDLFVLFVDAAVEVVGLALETVFVGALLFYVAQVAAAGPF